ncbi:MAG: capping complex subunit for YIEGIA [Bacillota bacterium]
MAEVNKILAIVTADISSVSGGAPIFLGKNDEECEQIARSLSRILDAMVHYLENNTYIIVSH